MELTRNKIAIFTLIILIIGAAAGLFLAGSDINSVRAGQWIHVDFIMMSILVLISCIVIYDILSTWWRGRRAGNLIFRVYSIMFKLHLTSLIFLVFALLFIVYYFSASYTMSKLLGFFILSVLILQFAFHLGMRDGINENGIIFWGEYFDWRKIHHFSWNRKSADILILKITMTTLGMKFIYDLKCRINAEEKDEIEKLLLRYIVKE